MPDGTYLNEVFAARIHKSNASSVAADCDDTIKMCRTRLLALALSAPRKYGEEEWIDYVPNEVREMCDLIEEEAIRKYMAEYIAEEPENCKDELRDEDWEDEIKA